MFEGMLNRNNRGGSGLALTTTGLTIDSQLGETRFSGTVGYKRSADRDGGRRPARCHGLGCSGN